jgi:hypothetical protein
MFYGNALLLPNITGESWGVVTMIRGLAALVCALPLVHVPILAQELPQFDTPQKVDPYAMQIPGESGQIPPLLERAKVLFTIDADTHRPDFFHRGQFSASYMTGLPNINVGPRFNATFGMLPQILRLNLVWNDPHPERILKGSLESTAEIFVVPVLYGPANIVTGSSVMLRYNYLALRDRRWVFYG